MIESLSRRALMSAPALLALARGKDATAQQAGGSRFLVAYFSRSGNTRVIAGAVQRALGADLFEIRPAQQYPEDYEQTVEQARRERDRGDEPALQAIVPAIASYDSVFLGFPIWGETAAPIIRSFLRSHDLAGKTLRPFITHGGYGLGNSLTVLADHAPLAKIEPPFSMEADQERRTLNQITGWLGTIGLP